MDFHDVNTQLARRHGHLWPFACQHPAMPSTSLFSGVDLPSPRMLGAARALLGLTQQALAKEAGVALGSLTRYESGATQLRSGTLSALVGVLRRHGIRFVAGSDGVAEGVLLMESVTRDHT